MLGNFRNLFCLLLLLCLSGTLAASAYGQVRRPLKQTRFAKKPPKQTKFKNFIPTPGAEPPGFFNNDGVTSERSMVVDPNVAIKLCVSQGNLRINGWRRNEVRVFVKHGGKFILKPLEKSAESNQVNWLQVVTAVESRPIGAGDCLAGDSIEIDAPFGSNLDLSGRAARTSVDSVKKVKVKIVEGVITLRNISGGINAYTSQGDVMVENSGGAIALESTTGNIVAVEVSPGQIGDLLKAKTNSGAISLQKVEHRQIEASSISGRVVFDGKFLKGGIYNFRTSNGSIEVSIPAASSCMFTATYGAGDFTYDLPLKILTENNTPRAKIVVARIGAGDAAVTLTTSTGTIGIRKAGSEL